MFMHHYFFSGRGPHFIGGPLVVVLLALLLAAVIALAFAFFTHGRRLTHASGLPAGQAYHGSDAARILDERFARGEIDDEEYLRRKRLLAAGPPSVS